MEILCFFAGTAFFYFKNSYPLLFLAFVFFLRPKWVWMYWFVAALLWCAIHQWQTAARGMPNDALMVHATLEGVVSSIPTQRIHANQFQLLTKRLNGKDVNVTIGLSCYNQCTTLHAGQTIQLQAKLKKTRNLANPGGFDYVAWLGARHIHWMGTVYKNSIKILKTTSKYPLLTLREQLSARQTALIPEENLLGMFQALTLGLTNHIDKSAWDLFRRTGTTHLIDISGEHIAMVAGLSYWLFKWIWKRLGMICLYIPAPRIGSIVALIMAFIYALIAGFAVPTQRSLIMACLMFSRHFSQKKMTIWQCYRYALFAVLVFEPHSVFMLGFYFSFLAVAILVLVNQRVKQSKWIKVLVMQSACLFGLMPLSIYWFSYASLNGLVANMIAIPWVSFLIVPLALIITFLSPYIVIPGSIPLIKWLMSSLLLVLNAIDSVAMFNMTFTFIEATTPLILMAGIGIFSLIPLKQWRLPTSVLILASLCLRPEKILPGEAKIDMLDVGQGLAVVIRTANHLAVYDTGMKFFQGNDIGKIVIIPYLNRLNVKRIDTIIISHADLDHRGGLESLEEKYTVNELIVDSPSYYHRGLSCHDHPSWTWDNVSFRFFPIKTNLLSKNNSSCVLQISTKAGAVLLSGDIEHAGEAYLTKTYGKELASSVLLIPHHGSKTSSSLDFISAVHPQVAMVSYGFDNRYHFPHKEALQNYERLHIPIVNTVDSGMITVVLKNKSKAVA